MVYFTCTGGSDYLDVIGDPGTPGVLAAMLDAARSCVSGFEGFRLYHIPSGSRTSGMLRTAAEELGLSARIEESWPTPRIDMTRSPEAALEAANRTSLVRHEKWFRRSGELVVHHWSDGDAIIPQLDDLFDQHVSRRAIAGQPSRFSDPTEREHFRVATSSLAVTGSLRFTRIDWDGRPIAFHLGSNFFGWYYWGLPSFDPQLSKRSPGEVLLRQLLLAAVDEGAHTFDFGLGGEAFKLRFANDIPAVQTWALEPRPPRDGKAGG